MPFDDELVFEKELITLLTENGWESKILSHKTEDDLIENWRQILSENNCEKDVLNHCPLTKTEMSQIIAQVNALETPVNLNGFINGKEVTIVRDNPEDELHKGQSVTLKIYDRNEIAAGKSRYQIAEQPIFKPASQILPSRRGDFMLLINGMPVIHVELKKTGIPISQATNQIEKYAHEKVFSGLFSLVQVFVAMTPEEMLYFANPGPYGKFDSSFFFHWADSQNRPINDWRQIVQTFLYIPMAHELIGFYTVADKTDGNLKVMRSYQYYASSAIAKTVAQTQWDQKNIYGGFVWHTTGSGKTMTSFKSAQLIASSGQADKVVFLMDRNELWTQSLSDYQGFADAVSEIQSTDDTHELISHLKSNNASETLIVTSIQKMSRVNADNLASQREVEKIRAKRLVFIVDECHRSTFGEMLSVIKLTFPNAIFFGFSGTPIWDKNKKHTLTTSDVFGPELHRYTIRNGIEDKNVLGFDPYMIETFSEHDLRVQIGLDKSKSSTVSEALSDPQKRAIFYHYQDSTQVPMVSSVDSSGNSVVGIEDLIPNTQYKEAEHQNAVVDSIIDNWEIVSHANKFHAILATSSIPEAIDYYHIFKKRLSEGKCTLRVTALFDKSTDGNDDKVIFKEDSLVEILTDYNEMYGQSYTIPTYSSFKVDVSERLAHKDPYKGISEKSPERLDLLIVVNQMLTGYDSHFLNALYLDKVLEYEGIIQAFSRTNRLCGPEKPFGIVKYYRKPHTMARNIEKAFDLYSGNQAFGIFVDKLEKNLNGVNEKFDEIKTIFESAGIPDFASLPKENEIKAKFANLFKELNQHLDAATIQGFTWKRMTYEFKDDAKTAAHTVTLHLDEKTYEILALRYKELFSGHSGKTEDVPYDIDSHLLEINTDAIDADYMNSRFTEYVKALHTDKAETILQELHKSFASLTQEEQKQAKVFLQDVQLGSIVVDSSKTFREYLTEYLAKARNDMIHCFAFVFGLDETLLRKMMNAKPNPANIDEFGRFSSLESTGDIVKAQNYFESKEGKSLKKSDVFAMFDDYLRRFVLEDGFDI